MSETATVEINLGKTGKELAHSWEKIVNCGNAALITRRDLQEHLKIAHEECGFRYVRCHGVLCDDLQVYQVTKQGKVVKNWQNIDYIYGSLLKIGMKPFVELSFMPKDLASGTQTIFTCKANVTPPKNYKLWGEFIRDLVAHLAVNFGHKEVKQWFFEVWNEPNLKNFWAGTKEDYLRLYQVTAQAIKSVDADFKVGGPATARGEWIEDFIMFCDKNSVPYDFLSTHIYPDDEDFFTLSQDYRAKFKGEEYLGKIVKYNHRLAPKAKNKPEMYWTEWNSSWRPCLLDREDSNQAAFICRTIHQIHNYVNAFSFWVVSDIYDEGGFPRTAFPRSYGLVNVNGLTKAGFNGFRFLHWLGDRELEVKSKGLDGRLNLWATDSGNGCQILVYYWQPPDKKKLPEREISIVLSSVGKKSNSYQLDKYLVDRCHSNVYSAWKKIGSPENLTGRETEFLLTKSAAEIVQRKEITFSADKNIKIQLDIRPGTVIFYDLKKIGKRQEKN